MPKTKSAKKSPSSSSDHGSAKSPSKKVNKSAYIRNLPHTLSAKEVVAKAAEAGIKLSIPQVYVARYNASKSSKKPAKAKRGPGRPKGSVNKAKATSAAPTSHKAQASRSTSSTSHSSQARLGGAEAQFANAALDLGLERAEQLLRDVRARLLNWKP